MYVMGGELSKFMFLYSNISLYTLHIQAVSVVLWPFFSIKTREGTPDRDLRTDKK